MYATRAVKKISSTAITVHIAVIGVVAVVYLYMCVHVCDVHTQVCSCVCACVHMRLCRCMCVYMPVCVCVSGRERNYLRKSSQEGSVC